MHVHLDYQNCTLASSYSFRDQDHSSFIYRKLCNQGFSSPTDAPKVLKWVYKFEAWCSLSNSVLCEVYIYFMYVSTCETGVRGG